MFKQAEQKQENKKDLEKESSYSPKGGSPLIAVSILLSGLIIAMAVLARDKVDFSFSSFFGKDAPVEEQDNSAEADSSLITVPDEGAPSLGDDNAPIVIYEISDFACPFCSLASGFGEDIKEKLIESARKQGNDATAEYWESVWVSPIPQIKEKYVDKGKVRLVFIPIPGHGQPSLKASEASFCAGDQGKFWEYHDKLFEEQSDWYQHNADSNSLLEKFVAYADELSLNKDDFKKCLDDDRHSKDAMEMHNASQAVLKQLKANKLASDKAMSVATPTYIINGRYLAGAQSFSEFEKIIEEELNK